MIVLDLRDESARAPIDVGDTSDVPPEERAFALRNWRDRMVAEHISSRVFAGFYDKLLRAGMPGRTLDLARAGMDEERSHAVLCARAVTALGGEARAPLPDPLPRVTQHDDADEIEAVLRDAISIGACSETVAVALVGAEREQAATPDLRDVLDRILADEIGHARLGWKLLDEVLPSAPARLKRRLSAYLVAVFEHQLRFHAPFLAMPRASDRGVSIGAPHGPSSFGVFTKTMTEVTIPGLDKRGLAASRAWSMALDRLRGEASSARLAA